MQTIELQGAAMTDRDAAYTEIMTKLDMPSYFGRNLDALFDVLSTYDEAEIVLRDTAAMLNANETYGCKLLACFYDSARENERLTFRAE